MREKIFKNEYENLVKKDLVSEKQLFVIGDININSLTMNLTTL